MHTSDQKILSCLTLSDQLGFVVRSVYGETCVGAFSCGKGRRQDFSPRPRKMARETVVLQESLVNVMAKDSSHGVLPVRCGYGYL